MAGPMHRHARQGRRRDVRPARSAPALGALAGEVLTASDIGLPARPGRQGRAGAGQRRRLRRGPRRRPRTTCCSTSRCARPPTSGCSPHVPWLREHLIGAVERLRPRHRAIDIVQASRRRCAASTRPTPRRCRSARGRALRARSRRPQQEAALERLETTLALVEGWVDEVVGQATAERMPAAAKLQEAIRRRRAAGGPAEETFAALVGLELRPRRLRDASTLWGSLRTRQGTEARDARLDAPRPAAHRRRPRRPAGLPRGLAEARRAQRRRLRRRAARRCSTAATGGAADGPDRADA